MRPILRLFPSILLVVHAALLPPSASAQDPPPRIGPFVVDVRGVLPWLPQEQALAESRGIDVRELPGRGLGLDAGAHVYLLRWKTITFGLGGQMLLAHAQSSPQSPPGEQLQSVTERLLSVAAELSLNFGSGDGWSYISGGIGQTTWSIVPDGSDEGPADQEGLYTVNYGAGARWFARPHLAFTVDVRWWGIDPGTPTLGRPGSPRTTLLVIGAGVALK
jgi:hypothetical protein